MDTVLVILIVAFAAGYIIRKFWGGSKQDASCDCGCDCSGVGPQDCENENPPDRMADEK